MSNGSRQGQFLSDENIKLIEMQAKELCKFYKAKYNFDIVRGKYVKNALIKTFRHYNKYLKEFDCKITSVDFYKVYSWLGYFLAEELHSKDMRYGVLRTAFWRLCKELERNGQKFDNRECIKKILQLIQNELDANSDFGIGKNGLYMLMKVASLVEIKSPIASERR